jgi:predicted RND superfamily exporter protein
MSSASSDPSKLGHKHRTLLAIERFSRSHYRLVFLMALLALIGGTWLGSKIELESNVLALIPEGNRQVDTLKIALEDFGSIDFLLVLLEAGEDEGPDELEDFADLFAERLEQLEGLVDHVEYRFELDGDFLELFYRNAVLFLPPDRLAQLEARLTDEAILERIEQIKLGLASPTASFTQDLIVNDPLGLMPLFLNRLEGNRGVLKIDISDGYYLSQDAKTLIMLVKPHGPSQDLEFDHALMTAVNDVEAATRAELRAGLVEGETGSHRVRVRYGGNYAIAIDEEALIRQDVSRNLIVSLLAVAVLYWLCYRRFAALLYSSLPLLVGQALTFALCFVVIGQLNASSSAFTALLMGLGTDFVIVVYARYIEERQKGRSLREATELMIGETGLGVFTGAITSAGTFFAMCYSEFRGLRDLGFLIGGGILLCAVAIIFMLPAMIKWNEGVRKRKVDSLKKLHLQSFGFEYLIPFSARHRWLVLATIAIMTIASGILAFNLGFDDTVTVLRSDSSEALRVQADVRDKFGASLSYMMAIAEADTQDEAVELTALIEERLQPFVEDGTVASSDSILSYLPPTEQQEQVLAVLHDDTSGAFDAERVRRTFVRGLEQNRFRPDAFSLRGPWRRRIPHRDLPVPDREALETRCSARVRRRADSRRRGHRRHRHQHRGPRAASVVRARGSAGGLDRLDRRLRPAAARLSQPATDQHRHGPADLRRDHDARRDEARRHQSQLRQRLRGDDDPRRRHRLQHPSRPPPDPQRRRDHRRIEGDRQGRRDRRPDQHRRIRYAVARQLSRAAQLRSGGDDRVADLPVHRADSGPCRHGAWSSETGGPLTCTCFGLR